MNRLTAALFLLPASCCFARAWAAGDMVTYPVGDEMVRAYLAKPTDAGPPVQKPGIVVVHHFWGLDTHTTGVVDRFAGLGYVTIAPDLYRGAVATDPGLAEDMMRKLDEGRAVAIVKAAIEYLRKLDRAARRPIALVGFDMGGHVSLAAALQGADAQGLVIFYGHVETNPDRLAPLKAEVLGIFGGRDRGVRVEEAKKFEEALKASGRPAKIVIYQGLAHAFFDETRPDFEPEMSKDAWVQTVDWLAATLRPKQLQRPAPATPGSVPSTGAPPGR